MPLLARSKEQAWASSAALDALGLPDRVGGIVTYDGERFPAAGQLRLPDYLGGLDPALFVPRAVTGLQPVSVVVIVAARPDLVPPFAASVQFILGAQNPTKISITTSANLAQTRAVVQGQLSSFSRGLLVVVFAVTAVLVAAILYGLVMLRRKDFGRRRALGATRSLIVALLILQTGVLAAIGTVTGSTVALITLSFEGTPLPGISFTAAVAILTVAVGVLAALLPAVAASRRDPLTELRVP